MSKIIYVPGLGQLVIEAMTNYIMQGPGGSFKITTHKCECGEYRDSRAIYHKSDKKSPAVTIVDCDECWAEHGQLIMNFDET